MAIFRVNIAAETHIYISEKRIWLLRPSLTETKRGYILRVVYNPIACNAWLIIKEQHLTTHHDNTSTDNIRADYDEETITVYQAYNRTIASAAVAEQKLNASPGFRTTRMTWIKPSWAWMLYRAGYSYKDPGQERILALKMKRTPTSSAS